MKLLLNKIVDTILKRFKLYIIYRLGGAIGEQVCMTSVIAKLRSENGLRAIVISKYPSIYLNNPNVVLNINYNQIPKGLKLLTYRILQYFDQSHIYLFSFKSAIESFEKYMFRTKNKEHLIQTNMYQINILKNTEFYSNEIYFSHEEINYFEENFRLPKEYAVVQPQGRVDYTPNKEWGFEKYQQVVEQVNDIIWVQVGVDNDKPLDNVIDLRGKTSLRELFYIIKRSNLILANEGLLNHVASSFDIKSFIVFSGFHPVEIAKYDNTIPIISEINIECSPCWLKTKCPHEVKLCTESVKVSTVVDEIRGK